MKRAALFFLAFFCMGFVLAEEAVLPATTDAEVAKALDRSVTFEADESTTFAELIRRLKDAGIRAELDAKNADALGITPESALVSEPVTYEGIKLRSCLRLVLNEHDLTYFIKDGKLVITAEEVAASVSSYKVHGIYPIVDLVVDPTPFPFIARTEAEIRECLRQRDSFDFDENGTFADLRKLLEQRCGVQAKLDSSCQALSISSKDRVVSKPVSFRNVTLSFFLRTVLREKALTYAPRSNVLLFTSEEEVERNYLDVRVYNVADLVVPDKTLTQDGKLRLVPDPEMVKGADFMELMDLVEALVSPDSWDGDAEMMEFYPALSLAVRQSEAVHEELENLLRDLRAFRAEQNLRGLFSDPPVIRAAEEDAVRAILKKPATLSLDENLTFDELFEQLREQFGLRFYLDAKGAEPMAISAASSVVSEACHYGDVPLGDLLRLVLKEHDLTWLVRESVVVVTSNEEAERNMVIRVYGVADLVVPEKTVQEDGKLTLLPDGEMIRGADFTELMDTIQSLVSPDSWDDNAEMMEFYPALALVVRQTDQGHEELENFLERLRKARAEQNARGLFMTDPVELPAGKE